MGSHAKSRGYHGSGAHSPNGRSRIEEEPIIHDAPPEANAESGKPPILRVRNLSRSPLLLDASLTLHAGEIVGLAGLIGSGRSELAQAIFGTLPPESGVIEVEGRPVTIRNPEDAIRLGIAYVPEDRGRQGLVTAMSVGQNISMTRLKHLTRGPFLNFNAEKMLAEGYVESLRIKTPNVRETVRNLSGGNQQKIVVAKWLATKPRILIVDEPTRGIDVGARAEIHRLIVALARDEGLAVVVISSDLQEVLRLADRVLVMHDGQITGEFTRAEATQEAVLTAALGNPEADNEINSSPDAA